MVPETEVTVTVKPKVSPALETRLHRSVVPTLPCSEPGQVTLAGFSPTVFPSSVEIWASRLALEMVGVTLDENEHPPNNQLSARHTPQLPLLSSDFPLLVIAALNRPALSLSLPEGRGGFVGSW